MAARKKAAAKSRAKPPSERQGQDEARPSPRREGQDKDGQAKTKTQSAGAP